MGVRRGRAVGGGPGRSGSRGGRGKMAPSSKSERGGPGGKRGPAGAAGGSSAGPGPRGRREHVVRQLDRVKISGQLSPRLFRKLPPRVCVSLKSIVDEDFLCAGHIFLGFSKCGRYVLSYTSNSGDDDFSFYIYHLYWWEFNVHSKLKLVRQVRLFQDEEIYSDLYLTVCEWPSDSSKVIVFGFNTRSANGLLVNMMMMSDENHRDIYISAVAVPPPGTAPAAGTRPSPTPAHCLRHGFMLHTKYQVVYPFPTFQPAFQLKKDQVVLLNTSYSLVACAVAVHAAGTAPPAPPGAPRAPRTPPRPPAPSRRRQQLLPNPLRAPEPAGALPPGGMRPPAAGGAGGAGGGRGGAAPRRPGGTGGRAGPGGAGLSPAVAKAKEFVADIFRRAKEATGPAPAGAGGEEEEEEDDDGGGGAAGFERPPPPAAPPCSAPAGPGRCRLHPASPRGDGGPAGEPPPAPGPPCAAPAPPPEPGYVNYTKLRYVLEPGEPAAPEEGELPGEGGAGEYEDDKISLPFVVTDLRGRSLKPLKERATAQGQYLTVEQLTLDFEYVINEVIRNDAAWSRQFCSFSDYDIVILEVCPETNQVIINIGLLLLAFPSPDEEGQLRPKSYHTSLKVAWDLNTGTFVTVSVGDLTEVKGQTRWGGDLGWGGAIWGLGGRRGGSGLRRGGAGGAGTAPPEPRVSPPSPPRSGSVWSSYRKGCVSSGRYVNRMTNEALHKGCSLKVLADNERYTWIVL
ncbi:hypothetical protein QYF61_022179 [Mycteria americana]|uniref:DDB1- and CUL4-associated factor 15 WD40 repeat-containing domain-containing protein n=1 Tax=Mycteria americana TaxID=33587 RepID=A0AAN7N7G1_MYCAM|nr:hypothetical protein QYF61_022179 [Mycteria americana]